MTDRAELGKTIMKRDRILQQATTKAEELKKNKLLIAHANTRIASMRKKSNCTKITAKDVSSNDCKPVKDACITMIFVLIVDVGVYVSTTTRNDAVPLAFATFRHFATFTHT